MLRSGPELLLSVVHHYDGLGHERSARRRRRRSLEKTQSQALSALFPLPNFRYSFINQQSPFSGAGMTNFGTKPSSKHTLLNGS
jgi:hypothetical protein